MVGLIVVKILSCQKRDESFVDIVISHNLRNTTSKEVKPLSEQFAAKKEV